MSSGQSQLSVFEQLYLGWLLAGKKEQEAINLLSKKAIHRPCDKKTLLGLCKLAVFTARYDLLAQYILRLEEEAGVGLSTYSVVLALSRDNMSLALKRCFDLRKDRKQKHMADVLLRKLQNAESASAVLEVIPQKLLPGPGRQIFSCFYPVPWLSLLAILLVLVFSFLLVFRGPELHHSPQTEPSEKKVIHLEQEALSALREAEKEKYPSASRFEREVDIAREYIHERKINSSHKKLNSLERFQLHPVQLEELTVLRGFIKGPEFRGFEDKIDFSECKTTWDCRYFYLKRSLKFIQLKSKNEEKPRAQFLLSEEKENHILELEVSGDALSLEKDKVYPVLFQLSDNDNEKRRWQGQLLAIEIME